MILGIDPGFTGALAFFGEGPLGIEGFFTIFDMPTSGAVKQRTVDAPKLADIIAPCKPKFAVVENVTAMGTWGAGSCFRFGETLGTIRGVLGALKIPVHLVAPKQWKKHYGLGGGTESKEEARRIIMERYPASVSLFARKKDHNRAESALLAVYGKQVIGAAA